ncbi:MAG: hypothetical protein KatS3mg027_1078 [Bacteroidia bacterium]|nr:MAG: hypothetical protein KatS3mg027_1078 [Bacteroidia bacterium]
MQKHPLLRYLFIASLTAIIIQLISLSINLVKDPKKSMLEQAEKLRDIKPDMANQLEEMAYEYETNKYFKVMPFVNLFFILLSLVAVVLMWQMNKKGWYVYLFSEFAPYVLSIFTWEDYIKYTSGFGGKTMAIASTLIMLAFDILFAGLYFYALRETEKLADSNNTDNNNESITI